jgi:hypothetical protein
MRSFSVAAAAKLGALAKAHAVTLSGVDPGMATQPVGLYKLKSVYPIA